MHNKPIHSMRVTKDLAANMQATQRKKVAVSYERVAAGIRSMIVNGEVAQWSWLRMQALADQFGVSVQPVREALQLLQGEGLVELVPNRGARVCGVNPQRLVQIYEIRAALESYLARQFAAEASQSDIRELESIQLEHDAAIDAGDQSAMITLNKRFHSCINSHGGNSDAIDLMQRYYDLTSSIRVLTTGFEPDYMLRVRGEHHALLDAIRQHDGARAAEVGALHVERSSQQIVATLIRGASGSSDESTPAKKQRDKT